jgi:hypothetical protein
VQFSFQRKRLSRLLEKSYLSQQDKKMDTNFVANQDDGKVLASSADDLLIVSLLVGDEDDINNPLGTTIPASKKGTVLSSSSPSRPRGLFLDNLDTALLRTASVEATYQRMCRIIDKFKETYYFSVNKNDNITSSSSSRCDPKSKDIFFGNYKDGWGFDMERFSTIYAQKFNVPAEKMNDKLWGDLYFDASCKVWRTNNKGGTLKERSVCQFVFSPLQQLCQAAMHRDWPKLEKMTRAIGIEKSAMILKKKDCSIDGQTLLSEIFRQWLPYSPSSPPLPDGKKTPSSSLSHEGREKDDDDRTTTTVDTENSTRTHFNSTGQARRVQSRKGLLRWFSKK